MITRSEDWKNALADTVRDPAELIELLNLPQELVEPARQAAAAFPLRVPRGFINRMKPGDSSDAVLRQILPLGAENTPLAGYSTDPVGDRSAAALPGLLHKYHGRVLLAITGACAVNCRYCFRRHFPYSAENPAQGDWQQALGYLRQHGEVNEVILSGGDPLVYDDERLAELTQRLAAIPHLQTLRIHSRLPIVLPERINDPLLTWLTGSRLQPVMVVHVNHPAELNHEATAALERLRSAGIPLLNQTVLLKGVNDHPDTLAKLSDKLFAAGVIPYYLHLLDRVQGAAHFEVPETHAIELVATLRARLAGYLVPRLVREIAGAPGKIPIT
ncbi:EF-P beta-lysylation protein EpmB [Thiohalomonas denitrificans]|uniref:L-lysine 2,3-aminomutase n=1 Tax=Thiohalomonas denitrificans TaxID=415747 RepID=A0A1G5PKJ6_9GAMM|nr:EF-P beta-lysylation protein EpmB [Thiohalomonas denitrificans]SCZ50033.1 L-lysine 2,3-aminomutase [Thiohalomonas denitrificans]